MKHALGVLLALLLTGPSATPAAPDRAEHPSRNVVLILVDDVGTDLLGCYEQFYAGYPPAGYESTTPCIDYLAGSGMTFRNAWTNPFCSPTRAQIMTGKHAHRSGIGKIVDSQLPITDGVGLARHHDTIPSVLSGVGYTCAAVGKWHLADASQFPPAPGESIHMLGTAAKPWFDGWMGPLNNLPQVDGYNRWVKTRVSRDGVVRQEPTLTYATVDTANDAIRMVENLPEPFFLYVAFNAAHWPECKPEYTVLQPARGTGADGPIVGDIECDFDAGDLAQKTRCMVQWMDNEVGRLLLAIENGTLAGPVTVILLGDNGTRKEGKVAPFPLGHTKGTVYDGGINVPLIVKSDVIPPSLKGSVSSALACSTDLLATIAELANAPLPPDPYSQRESISLVPALLGLPGERAFTYAESFKKNFVPDRTGAPPASFSIGMHRRAIRNEAGFKLIQVIQPSIGGGVAIFQELYDLNADPHELSSRMAEVSQHVEPYRSNFLELRRKIEDYPVLVE